MFLRAIAATISSSVIGGFKSFISPGLRFRLCYLHDSEVIWVSFEIDF